MRQCVQDKLRMGGFGNGGGVVMVELQLICNIFEFIRTALTGEAYRLDGVVLIGVGGQSR